MGMEKSEQKQSKAKKQGRFRLLVQAVSFAFHNGYINGWLKGSPYSGSNKLFCMPGLNCYSCPGAIGACPIGSLQAVLDSGVMKYSLYVLGFIGMIGMLCGRLVCGWLCPFGAIQDLLYRIPLFKKVKNLPGHKYLRWLKYGILLVFVILLPMLVAGPGGTGQPWFCEWICPSGTLLGGIPLVLSNLSLRASAGLRFAWKVALLLLILVGAIKVYRPFCKYLCPLGALYGSCNKLSLYRLKVDEEKCVRCGACQKACGMDIPVYQLPNSVECIRCGKCMAACPTGAITSTFGELVNRRKASPSVPSPEETLSSKATRLRTIFAPLVGLSGLAALVYGLCAVFACLIFSRCDGLIYFVIYYGMNLGVTLTGLIALICGIKLLSSRKKPGRSVELREFAAVGTGISIAANLILAPLMLFFCFCVMNATFSLAYFQNVGSFMLTNNCLFFWAIPTLFMLLASLALPRKEK